ncbi:hypothetical protein Y032_0016g3000 [Ancylostoma ceylanicum]|uniref:Uncharacterized protein n=1 Tax=Ancylostoma ceylanicum TaxID=53326 RepID=A0A016V5Z6_9BILA|nr:hypothetical protein Y032_0016g3000 [Ancylostoma ceylanicum]
MTTLRLPQQPKDVQLGTYSGQDLISSSDSDNTYSNFSQASSESPSLEKIEIGMNPIRMEALTLPRNIGASQSRYENHFFNPDYCATVGRIRPLYDSTLLDERFWNIVTLPLRRSGPALALAMTIYIIGYNVGVRWWKGPDHPVNRFTWRRMEKEGLLSEEMLQKKKTVLDYYKSRFFGGWTDPYSSSDAY